MNGSLNTLKSVAPRRPSWVRSADSHASGVVSEGWRGRAGLCIGGLGLVLAAVCYLLGQALRLLLAPASTLHFLSMLALTFLAVAALSAAAELLRPQVQTSASVWFRESHLRSGERIVGAVFTGVAAALMFVVGMATGQAWAAVLFMFAWVPCSLWAMGARRRQELTAATPYVQPPPPQAVPAPAASAPAGPAELPAQLSHDPDLGLDPTAPRPFLKRFGTNLTARAKAGELDPVIGRDAEVERVVRILAQKRKGNPVLIGESGVGKTAVMEGLALRIAAGTVPDAIKDMEIWSIEMTSFTAGSKYVGVFDEKFNGVIREVKESNGQVLLFIDELHTLIGAGTHSNDPNGASQSLKPSLAKGEVRIAGATTKDEYRLIEKDAALARRFETVRVDEPSPEDAIAILVGLRDGFERHHRVHIADEAVEAAVKLSVRYIRDRFLPDKAIDLIDEAAAMVRTLPTAELEARIQSELSQAKADAADAAGNDSRLGILARADQLARQLTNLRAVKSDRDKLLVTVGARDIERVVEAKTGIPVGDIYNAGERETLLNLENALRGRVIGQDHAVELVADAVRQQRVGLGDPKRPASFLFVGPSGVGKTELAEALAAELPDTHGQMVALDMSEYQGPVAVYNLIGWDDRSQAGVLTEPVRRNPYTVVLLDEIEKTTGEVLNLLLQVLEKGRLTDKQSRVVDFSNTIVIMTSNIGSLGGKSTPETTVAAVRAALSPELFARIDEVVPFGPLSPEDVRRIARLQVASMTERVRAERDISLEMEPALLAKLAADGYDPDLGARPLRRLLSRTVVKALTDAVLRGTVRNGDTAVARLGENGVEVERVGSAAGETQRGAAWASAS